MNAITILSIAVSVMGVLMSLGHFPQAYKIYKNRSAKDISIVTYSIFTLGAVVWLAYSVVLQEWPIIASFIVGVIGAGSVLALAIRYRS
jgi:MtN3 and saliva related transmembrane protein